MFYTNQEKTEAALNDPKVKAFLLKCAQHELAVGRQALSALQDQRAALVERDNLRMELVGYLRANHSEAYVPVSGRIGGDVAASASLGRTLRQIAGIRDVTNLGRLKEIQEEIDNLLPKIVTATDLVTELEFNLGI